jgi:glycine cleavage system H protein
MSIPENLKYTKDHEWIRIEGETAVIGITDYAQGELGDIIFVEYPGMGDSFPRGDIFGTVEAVKTVADLFMPLSGEILAVNSDLEDAPEKVNNDPYGEGWMIKVRVTDMTEVEELLDVVSYRNLIS